MNVYDQVHYVGFPHQHSHPDRLAVVAGLYGLSPARPEACRMLEIGCGDGGNLIPIAATYPRSEFTGIDLAGKPIEMAREQAKDFGIANARFERFNLMDLDRSFGEFDYIIAHGVYCWVPDPVRDKLMAVLASNLAPNGIGFISYNAYPGCHIRAISRGMMRYHTRGTDGFDRVSRAKEMVEFAAAASLGGDEWKTYTVSELKRLNDRREYTLYHDELGEHWQPVYFHEFVDHAGRHGLEFVAEAQYSVMKEGLSGPPQQVLESLHLDRIERQQYLDFLFGRAFRQTLLCRQGLNPSAKALPERVVSLHVSCDALPQGDSGQEFRNRAEAVLEVKGERTSRVLRLLGQEWPETRSFHELKEMCGSIDDLEFAELLLQFYALDFVHLHGAPRQAVCRPGERPRTRNLARMQAARSAAVTSALHEAVNMNDERSLKLLLLLDGTRDRAALARDMGGDLSPEELWSNVEKLARAGLIEE